MAHFSVTDEEKARLLQKGRNGEVVEMITLVKELAGRDKVTTGEVIVHVEDAIGQHLGHHCAKSGTPTCRAALVRCLMEFTPAQKGLRKLFLESRDRAGNTPLLVAARQGQARTVALLVSQGAFLQTKNDARQTVLHQAVRAHSLETLETAILHGADINPQDVQGWTPLHGAADHNDLEACQRIIDQEGADLVAQEKRGGNTALHLAARAGHVDIVGALDAAGALLDDMNHDEATALHLAAAGGHTAVVAMLVDQGADVNAQDSTGSTPLHAAVRSKKDGTLGCIETLLASDEVKPELRDTMWKTAKELAHGRKDILAIFKRMSGLNA